MVSLGRSFDRQCYLSYGTLQIKKLQLETEKEEQELLAKAIAETLSENNFDNKFEGTGIAQDSLPESTGDSQNLFDKDQEQQIEAPNNNFVDGATTLNSTPMKTIDESLDNSEEFHADRQILLDKIQELKTENIALKTKIEIIMERHSLKIKKMKSEVQKLAAKFDEDYAEDESVEPHCSWEPNPQKNKGDKYSPQIPKKKVKLHNCDTITEKNLSLMESDEVSLFQENTEQTHVSNEDSAEQRLEKNCSRQLFNCTPLAVQSNETITDNTSEERTNAKRKSKIICTKDKTARTEVPPIARNSESGSGSELDKNDSHKNEKALKYSIAELLIKKIDKIDVSDQPVLSTKSAKDTINEKIIPYLQKCTDISSKQRNKIYLKDDLHEKAMSFKKIFIDAAAKEHKNTYYLRHGYCVKTNLYEKWMAKKTINAFLTSILTNILTEKEICSVAVEARPGMMTPEGKNPRRKIDAETMDILILTGTDYIFRHSLKEKEKEINQISGKVGKIIGSTIKKVSKFNCENE